MVHLAPIGYIFEGPGLTGNVIAHINAPMASLCGVKVTDEHSREEGSCKACLLLALTRRSNLTPLVMGGGA